MTGQQQFRFRVRREGTGYSVAGKGFYVWDEGRSSAVRAAMQLAGRNPAGAHAKRLLYYGNDTIAEISSASPEALDS
jgi:hypothetical protein